MRRLPHPLRSPALQIDRRPRRTRARAEAREELLAHRRNRSSGPLLVTGGAAVGATATAWSGGSPAVPVVATLCAAIAAGALAARHRARRHAVTGPRARQGAPLRRATHRAVAALVLVLVLPLLLAVALAVELTSRGPVLLRRARVGAGPALAFRCTDRWGRTTRLGQLLARPSLDEHTALLDVVTGRMALLGPARVRPGRPAGRPTPIR